MSRILISPVTAVTCNDDFEVIANAAIHIENNRIVFVGHAKSAPPFEADETLGGAHLVAMPGLVNTHCHAAMTLLRGYADDMALEPWLHEKIWPFESHLQRDDVYWGTFLAIIEMLRGGTTTFADMYFHYRDGARAIIESGIRACPGGVLLGFLPHAEQSLQNALAFVREYSGAGDNRVTPFLAPHSLYTCNPKQWETIIAAAHAGSTPNGTTPITTHVAETQREVADVTRDWGASPVQTLEKIGALETPFLAAHCVHVNETDLEIMARTNFRVSHNPTSNLKLASGFAPVPEFIKRAIPTGVATDGAASNNNLDLWEEMRLAALIHKATTGDPTAVSSRQAVLMATREGARCLNLEHEIGSLETGKKADVILLDFDAPHLTPCHNVVSHLAYCAGAGDVHSVIVDGKVLLRGREWAALDTARVMAHARECAARLANIA
jgi:5-methylthioadenosine/S-adenosylhomocysteine deaminase